MCSKNVILLLLFQVRGSVPDACDMSKYLVPVGNLGQTGMFPWLGVIRVHLHEGDKLRIALTGTILVKPTYSIAVAEDIAKIPKKIFQADSRAMFFAYDAQPWLFSMRDYILHPEYEYAMLNTIALIELDPDDMENILPICWPTYMYNASNQLYALGYTDEKEVLEKEIHRMQYMDKGRCEDYYYRIGGAAIRYTPTYYVCGSAVNESTGCQWDNGMVLASNASGPWVVVGLGILGAGCAAPSRFIEIYQYLQWIDSSTTNVKHGDIRNSAFEAGFEQLRTHTKNRFKDIPVHNFFRQGSETNNNNSNNDDFVDWFSNDYQKGEYREYNIKQLDKDTISIHTSFKDKFEKEDGACDSIYNKLVYTETAKIYSTVAGFAYYRLSLMDLMVDDYTCVIVRIEAPESDDTELWYNTSMIIDEPLSALDRSPGYHIKYYPIYQKDVTKEVDEDEDGEWKPNEKLEPHFILDDAKSTLNQSNVNVFLKLKFKDQAYLKIQVWGPRGGPTTTTTTGVPRFRLRGRGKSVHRTLEQPKISHVINSPLKRIISTRMPYVTDSPSRLQRIFSKWSPVKDTTHSKRNTSTRQFDIENSSLNLKHVVSTMRPHVEDITHLRRNISTSQSHVENSSSRLKRMFSRMRPHLEDNAHLRRNISHSHVEYSSSHLNRTVSTLRPNVDETTHLTRNISTRRPHVEDTTHLRRNVSSRRPHVENTTHLRRNVSTRRPHVEDATHLRRKTSTRRPHAEKSTHLRRNISERMLHIHVQQDEVERTSGEARLWASHGSVHSDTVCFLAFLHLLF